MIRMPTAVTILSIAVMATPAFAANDPLAGNWARGDGVAKVVIKPCGGKICAVNTWIKPGTTKEKVGDKLVMTIDKSADGTFGGQAFDPQRNLTYKLTINVSAESMTTRGCVLGGIICKSQNWTRIN